MFRRSISAIIALVLFLSVFTVGAGISYAINTDIPDQPGITATTTNSVSLSWAAIQGADGYNVYRSQGGNGVFLRVNTSIVVPNSYTDTSLNANTRYDYKISFVIGGVESYLSVAASGLTQPDFGPNVYVFDPTMPAVDIQSISTNVFTQQESNQFGSDRYALLFKPGNYNTNVRVGFYTQVSGLGQVPDDVTINGGVTVDANWMANHNATDNFWRSVENLSVVPSSGNMLWAVSQAAPMRRLHVKGGLTLHDQGGWASGGFLADSRVDGGVVSGSQQQWMSRNSQWSNWNGSLWNMTFVGDVNAPADNWPTNANTVVDKTPMIREKPFLTFDTSVNQYKVFVPNVASDTSGTSWAGGYTAGASIPIENFLIANPSTSIASINSALDQGKNLLFTPGIYHLNDTIRVTNPNTVVMGLGFATLIPDNGQVAMSVADVDGVKISGLLFEAGSNHSASLMEVGSAGSSADHSANPTFLYDLTLRIGGAIAGSADVGLKINSNNVIGDDLWIWRADHGAGAGWTSNPSINGLIVNGNNVIMYGLFNEHHEQYQTLWNGNGGRVYFYQSEIPYDVPSQSAWMSSGGAVNGFASYKVADSVTTHEAYGIGVYSFFRDADVKLESAIEAPDTPGVKIHHATTVYLSGYGEITHIANKTGTAVKSGAMRTTLTDYVPRTTTSITPVNIATITGKAPALPAFVTQKFTDSTTKQAPVAWGSIDPSQYASVGTFTVQGTVNAAADASNNPVRALANVTVNPAPNVAVTDIAVTSAGNVNAIATKGGTLQMAATVTPANADNLAVAWSVLNLDGSVTDKATISAGGLLTAAKDGLVKVVASAVDGTGVTASQTITISGQIVKVSSITVVGQNNAAAIIYKGGTLQMLANVLPANADIKAFTWSVVNGTGSATIDSSGLLTAKSDGTVSVVATASDGSGVKGTQTIAISGQALVLNNGWSWVRESRDNWALTGNPNVMRLTTIEGSWSGTKPSNILLRDPGASDFTISTKLNFNAAANFEWAGLIVYQDDGNLISLGRDYSGSKQIRFSQVKNSAQTDKNYADVVNSVTGDVYLKIVKTGAQYKGYYSSDGSSWTTTADTFTPNPALSNPNNGGSNPSVGIFVRKLGPAAKTAEFTDFNVNGTIIPYWVPVSMINVTGAGGGAVITTNGGSLQMSAQVLPANASSGSVIWSVYNTDNTATDKAVISSSGLLTAVKNGQVKVVARAYDGSGVTGSATITITGQPVAVESIAVMGAGGAAAIATKGGSLQMSAQVLPANASNQTVTWSVYNTDNTTTDKAAISSSGLLTAAKNGQVKVVAAATDGSGVSGSTLVDISSQVLLAPTIQTVVAGTGHVTISWSPMNGAVTYSVYQRTSEGAYGAALAIVNGSVSSYDATGLVNGTTFHFIVKAVYPGGTSDASNEVSATPKAPIQNITTDNAPASWVNKDVTVTLTAIDRGSGVAATYYTLDGGAQQSGTTVNITSEGTHTLTYWSVDQEGIAEVKHTATVRIDKIAPTANVVLDKNTLWPANHQLASITASVTAADSLSGINSIVLTSITSNEPDNGLEAGDQSNDIQGAEFGTFDTGFMLRAERTGNGTGRMYTITYTVTDNAGNTTNASAIIVVPHDQSGKK
ncbi:Ig-like domain-containing protein [Paenibacillus cremeus]|uniref:DUF1349 domain-containing protein n=1 Tax=Paenibacillus cremeus TaxID=2163881 RepID=A0A559K5W2_9BACL|nr:Ig-like domain-containing protein [Paenibacillus cremeus]TVY07487.1 DUF1349 domain-containing protein [Paenibacillus cremeus]